jgi:hypothetical protein
MTSYLTKQHRVDKAARKEEKLMVSANNSGSYRPLRDTVDRTEEYAESFPRLRRMPKFTDIVKERLNIKSAHSQQQNLEGEDSVKNLQKLRQDMKEGRLEQVVPPRQPSRTESRLAPPQDRFVDQPTRVSGESIRARSSSRHRSSSHQRNSSRGRKTRSTSSKLADYIRTSADILDEKRRDVQSKFQAPFEHLNYPSFSLSQRVSVSSSKSAESFWCIGEDTEEQKASTQAIHGLKANQQKSAGRGRRLSGVGVNPWTNHVPDNCKHCGQFAMIGRQGLCEECEYRGRGRGLGYTNQYPDSDIKDDIRPTPPLKDHKLLSMRRERDPQRVFQVGTRSSDDEKPPPVPVKDMGSRPIFNPTPPRQYSQSARVEEEGDDEEEWYLNWKTSSQRDEFEKTQSMFGRWSLNFENDDPGKKTEEGEAPLIEGKGRRNEKKKDLSRDTNFYGFYDDVLEDH